MPFSIATFGLSVCEHFRHVLVSPTYKLKSTDIFHTSVIDHLWFLSCFNNAVRECYTNIKHSLKDSDKETP